MNPRRVHELMAQHFPAVEHARREWSVVPDDDARRGSAIQEMLAAHIGSTEVLVEVHRKMGGLLPLPEAALYIASHVGEGEIRVTDRQFTGFVVVARNGVATGWRAMAGPSFQRPASGVR